MPIATKVFTRHRAFWNRYTALLFAEGILLFIFALAVQNVAYGYVDHRIVATPVGDLLLGALPAVNLDIFIVQGALLLTILALCLAIAYPSYLPFSLKTISFFLIIRSFFISLTHLGANLHQITLNTSSIGFQLYDVLYNGKNDFFFSGHVGAPFLLALIFWEKPFWRYLFLVSSFILGASMLLAHMHYSIDVFAAPFITYGIFTISRKVFKNDFSLTTQN